MKRMMIYICMLFLSCLMCNAQDRLQRAIDGYDYKTALTIIDSLVADIGTDSVSLVQNKEKVVDLALQKSRCLRKV